MVRSKVKGVKQDAPAPYPGEDNGSFSTPDKNLSGHEIHAPVACSPQAPLTPELSSETTTVKHRLMSEDEDVQKHSRTSAGIARLTAAQKIKMAHLKAMLLDMQAARQASRTKAEQDELEAEMSQIQDSMTAILPSVIRVER
jgi:hypothetical protein